MLYLNLHPDQLSIFQNYLYDFHNMNIYDYGNDELNIKFSVESREYNDKWYTSLNCFYLNKINLNTIKIVENIQETKDLKEKSDDLPF